MQYTIRSWVMAAVPFLLLGAPAAWAGDPFYVAGVAGVADANDNNAQCGIKGGFSEGYQTYPQGAFTAFAQGRGTSFNPCSALSGSPLSVASANLATGQLKVYALAQLGAAPYQQEARARAYFGDDVMLFAGNTPLTVLPDGLVGEIRLNIHGNRSAELQSAEASLDVRDLQGRTIGEVDLEDLQGGEALVVQFTTPFSFFADLDVIAGDGQFADFGSTGTVSITLPAGYRFGSSSGVLLSPVPEPAAWALWLAGLGALRLARRRVRAVALVAGALASPAAFADPPLTQFNLQAGPNFSAVQGTLTYGTTLFAQGYPSLSGPRLAVHGNAVPSVNNQQNEASATALWSFEFRGPAGVEVPYSVNGLYSASISGDYASASGGVALGLDRFRLAYALTFRCTLGDTSGCDSSRGNLPETFEIKALAQSALPHWILISAGGTLDSSRGGGTPTQLNGFDALLDPVIRIDPGFARASEFELVISADAGAMPAVPEPAAWWLLLAGGAGIRCAALLRRRPSA